MSRDMSHDCVARANGAIHVQRWVGIVSQADSSADDGRLEQL